MNSTRGEPAPLGREHHPSSDRDQVYYDQDGVLITATCLKAHGRAYPIAELRHIRTMRGPHSDLTVYAGFAAAAVVIAMAMLRDYLGIDGWVGAIAVLSFAVVLAIAGHRLRQPLYIMLAEYRTLTVLLVMEEDGTRYARIRRALLAARDALG
jgi:hypothetical protein